jgi:hypothetical protein
MLETNVHLQILKLLKTKFQDKESPYAFRALACLGWMNAKGQKDLQSLDFANLLIKSIRTFSESVSFITEACYALCGVFDGNKAETEKICAESVAGEKLILDILLDAVKKNPVNSRLAAKVSLALGSMSFANGVSKQILQDKTIQRWKTLISVYKTHRQDEETLTWVSYAIANNLQMIPKNERAEVLSEFKELVPLVWSDVEHIRSNDQAEFFMPLFANLMGLPEMMKRFVDEPSNFQMIFDTCSRFKVETKYLLILCPVALRSNSTPASHICFDYVRSFILHGGGFAHLSKLARDQKFCGGVVDCLERYAFFQNDMPKVSAVLRQNFPMIYKIIQGTWCSSFLVQLLLILTCIAYISLRTSLISLECLRNT